MPRSTLEHWLVSHFLRLALPFPRPAVDRVGSKERAAVGPQLADERLNMTAFFRLIRHVASLGYPVLWISDLLASLCDGEVVTTARAPRARPSTYACDYPLRKISVRAFTAEFRALLAVWLPLLGLSLARTTGEPNSREAEFEPLLQQRRDGPGLCLPSSLPPTLGSLRSYDIRFDQLPAHRQQLARVASLTPRVSALVLMHVGVWIVLFEAAKKARTIPDLRRMLLDDERGYAADPMRNAPREVIRQVDRATKGACHEPAFPGGCAIHVFSTFEWDADRVTATIWLEEALVSRMHLAKCWTAAIWRTDTWTCVLGPMDFRNGPEVRRGVLWR